MNVAIGPPTVDSVAAQDGYSASGHYAALYRKLNNAQTLVFKTVKELLRIVQQNQHALRNLSVPEEECVTNDGVVDIQYIDNGSNDGEVTSGCFMLAGRAFRNKQTKGRGSIVCPNGLAFLPPGSGAFVSKLVPGAWYDVELPADAGDGTEVWACKYVPREDVDAPTGLPFLTRSHVLVRGYRIGNQKSIRDGSVRLADSKFHFVADYDAAFRRGDGAGDLHRADDFPHIRGYGLDLKSTARRQSALSLDTVLWLDNTPVLNVPENISLEATRRVVDIQQVVRFRGPMVLNLRKGFENGARRCRVEKYTAEDHIFALNQILDFPEAPAGLQTYTNPTNTNPSGEPFYFDTLQTRVVCDARTVVQYHGEGRITVQRPVTTFSPDIGLCGYFCRIVQPRFHVFDALQDASDFTRPTMPMSDSTVNATAIVSDASRTASVPDPKAQEFQTRHRDDALATLDQLLKVYSSSELECRVLRNDTRYRASIDHSGDRSTGVYATPDGFVVVDAGISSSDIIGIVVTKCDTAARAAREVSLRDRVNCLTQFYVLEQLEEQTGEKMFNRLEYIFFVSWTTSECLVHTYRVAHDQLERFRDDLSDALRSIDDKVVYNKWRLMALTPMPSHVYPSMFSKRVRVEHEFEYAIPVKSNGGNLDFVLTNSEDGDGVSTNRLGKVREQVLTFDSDPYQLAETWLHYKWEVRRDRPNAGEVVNDDEQVAQVLHAYVPAGGDYVVHLAARDVRRLQTVAHEWYRVDRGGGVVCFVRPVMNIYTLDPTSKWCTASPFNHTDAPVLCVRLPDDGILYLLNLEIPCYISHLNRAFFSAVHFDWQSTPAFAEGDRLDILRSRSGVRVVNQTTTLSYRAVFSPAGTASETAVVQRVSRLNGRVGAFRVFCADGQDFVAGTIADALDAQFAASNRDDFEQLILRVLHTHRLKTREAQAAGERVVHATIRYFLQTATDGGSSSDAAPARGAPLLRKRWIKVHKPARDSVGITVCTSAAFERASSTRAARSSVGARWVQTTRATTRDVDPSVFHDARVTIERGVVHVQLTSNSAHELDADYLTVIEYDVHDGRTVRLRPEMASDEVATAPVEQVVVDEATVRKIEEELGMRLHAGLVLRRSRRMPITDVPTLVLREMLRDRGVTVDDDRPREFHLMLCRNMGFLQVSKAQLSGNKGVDDLSLDELQRVATNRQLAPLGQLRQDVIDGLKARGVDTVFNLEVDDYASSDGTDADESYDYFGLRKQSAINVALGVAHRILESAAPGADEQYFVKSGDALVFGVPSYAFKWQMDDGLDGADGLDDSAWNRLLDDSYTEQRGELELRVVHPRLLVDADNVTRDTRLLFNHAVYRPFFTPNMAGQFVVNKGPRRRFVHLRGESAAHLAEKMEQSEHGTLSITPTAVVTLANGAELVYCDFENLSFTFSNPPDTFVAPGLPRAVGFFLKLLKLAVRHARDKAIDRVTVNLTTKANKDSILRYALSYALFVARHSVEGVHMDTSARQIRTRLESLERLDPADAKLRITEILMSR